MTWTKLKGLKAQQTHYKGQENGPKKTQITIRAQGPPTTRSTRRDPATARTHATAQTTTPFGTSPGTKGGEAKQRNAFTPRDLDRRRQSYGSLYLAGTGTGVDGAEGASASRRQNQITERETSPRLPHPDRALAPETDPPRTAISRAQARRLEEETKPRLKTTALLVAGGLR
ncbi:hypothetical protein IGI04_022148 [Brassica rapa subsp. trilocularis]|uniref:DUF4005 domain-containing protein n=1 Tax=Brassica rapa subsp. trilocularis TaxID=1813537 RepID=A0ABQ7M2W5_BRACM|nr:hypothetical protein IGI04_022148 [Brassica rapa subsp. trilocularis]